MRARTDTRRGWWAFGLTVSAFVWGLGLVAAAFVAPFYREYTNGSSETRTFSSESTSTIVEMEGLGGVVPLALPAALTLLVWFALHRKCSRGSRRFGDLAWWLVGLLGVFSLLAFSIGTFVLPVVMLLAAAAALTPVAALPGRSSPRRHGTR